MPTGARLLDGFFSCRRVMAHGRITSVKCVVGKQSLFCGERHLSLDGSWPFLSLKLHQPLEMMYSIGDISRNEVRRDDECRER